MADVLAVRDKYRAQAWAMLIQECKVSGMTNKDFCEQRGVSEKASIIGSASSESRLLKQPHRSLFLWSLLLHRKIFFKSASGEQS